jgi:hypothetical protein
LTAWLTSARERICSTERKFLGACLEFLEQANVLDGDDGLIREGLEKIDLLVRKCLNPPCGEEKLRQ